MQVFFRSKFFILCALSLLLGCKKESPEVIVEIPDRGFLSTLLAQNVDQNGDGVISIGEAEATESLLIPPSEITDLTGLEAFVNLDSLSINLNPLSGIDLSSNIALKYLMCTYCELKSLDVSNNLLLEELICFRNSLSELDVSQNLALHTLLAKNNLLTSLDLSANTGLKKMISCGNQLTRLDISMLSGLKTVGVDNMPMLTEVCVWTLPFPPEGIVLYHEFSPNVVFTDQCNGF